MTVTNRDLDAAVSRIAHRLKMKLAMEKYNPGDNKVRYSLWTQGDSPETFGRKLFTRIGKRSFYDSLDAALEMLDQAEFSGRLNND